MSLIEACANEGGCSGGDGGSGHVGGRWRNGKWSLLCVNVFYLFIYFGEDIEQELGDAEILLGGEIICGRWIERMNPSDNGSSLVLSISYLVHVG